MYKVSGRNESAFSRLPYSPPAADSHKPDAYPMYEWLPRPLHPISKGVAANRNERLPPQVAKQSEQPCEARKGYTKTLNMPNHLLATVLEERLNQSIKHPTAIP